MKLSRAAFPKGSRLNKSTVGKFALVFSDSSVYRDRRHEFSQFLTELFSELCSLWYLQDDTKSVSTEWHAGLHFPATPSVICAMKVLHLPRSRCASSNSLQLGACVVLSPPESCGFLDGTNDGTKLGTSVVVDGSNEGT